MFEKAEQEYQDVMEKKRIVENDKRKIELVMQELDEKKNQVACSLAHTPYPRACTHASCAQRCLTVSMVRRAGAQDDVDQGEQGLFVHLPHAAAECTRQARAPRRRHGTGRAGYESGLRRLLEGFTLRGSPVGPLAPVRPLLSLSSRCGFPCLSDLDTCRSSACIAVHAAAACGGTARARVSL